MHEYPRDCSRVVRKLPQRRRRLLLPKRELDVFA